MTGSDTNLGGTAVAELPEIARSAMERQRTAAIFDELVRTVRGEYGDFDGGLCTPTWDLWGHHMVRHRERIEMIVAGADDPAEALWRDPTVRSAAHDLAHERCCEDAHHLSTDAWYELVNSLADAARGDGRAPGWLERTADWDAALARLDGNAHDYDLISTAEELIDDGPLDGAVSDEGTRRHVAVCPRGSVTGPSGWIHSW